jgi:hypothetical protein
MLLNETCNGNVLLYLCNISVCSRLVQKLLSHLFESKERDAAVLLERRRRPAEAHHLHLGFLLAKFLHGRPPTSRQPYKASATTDLLVSPRGISTVMIRGISLSSPFFTRS